MQYLLYPVTPRNHIQPYTIFNYVLILPRTQRRVTSTQNLVPNTIQVGSKTLSIFSVKVMQKPCNNLRQCTQVDSKSALPLLPCSVTLTTHPVERTLRGPCPSWRTSWRRPNGGQTEVSKVRPPARRGGWERAKGMSLLWLRAKVEALLRIVPRPSEAELAVRTYVREALFTGLKLKNIKFCARSLLYVFIKMWRVTRAGNLQIMRLDFFLS